MLWIPVLLGALTVAAGICMAVAYRFFRIACIPRGKEALDGYFDTITKAAGADAADAVRRAIADFHARKGEPLSIQSEDGLTLRGYYLAPPIPTNRILLMCHGWNSSPSHDFAPALNFFHSLGFGTLLIDQRAQGASGGRYMTFGAKEHRDVLCWIEAIRTRFGEDTSIVLDGLSMGATTVLLAAGEPLPLQVKAVIADSGYDSAVEELRHLGRRYRLPIGLLLPLCDIWARILGGFSFYDTDTKSALDRCTLPVLLIHGTADTFVPHECTLRNAVHCQHKTMVLVDGAGHGLSYLLDKNGCQQHLRDFLTTI